MFAKVQIGEQVDSSPWSVTEFLEAAVIATVCVLLHQYFKSFRTSDWG
jgi:hypothetical protein